MFDAKKVKNEIVEWMTAWFEKNGNGCNAVVGVSGGKDSSVVAALCVAALGKDRVIGVLMPNGEQSDIKYSHMLCDHLGIKNYTVNVGPAINGVLDSIHENAADIEVTEQTYNKSSGAYSYGNFICCFSVGKWTGCDTCNLSETLLSWETRWGDAVGDFAPTDLTVDEVKAIGYELGLPKELIEKIPSDGLCGSTDEDALGFKYAVMDRYIRTGEIEDKQIKHVIDKRVEKYRSSVCQFRFTRQD